MMKIKLETGLTELSLIVVQFNFLTAQNNYF